MFEKKHLYLCTKTKLYYNDNIWEYASTKYEKQKTNYTLFICHHL